MLCTFTEKQLLTINSCITTKICKLKDSLCSCEDCDKSFYTNWINELVALRSSISDFLFLHKI